jgi:hypothetical protein
MSFDLRVLDGDISFDPQGNLEIVANTDKLAQDVVKMLNTSKGSNPFDPSYGTTLTEQSIGTIPDGHIIATKVEQEINSNLEKLMAEQATLRSRQVMTRSEMLAQVASVNVARDDFDPRQYNVIVEVLARDLAPLTFEFVVKT